MVSPGSTNPTVTQTGDYIFRVCFIDPFQGTVMAKFALDTLHAKKVAILSDVTSDYSKGLSQYFTEYYKGHGGADRHRALVQRRRQGQGFPRATHRHQGRAARRDLRARLLHGSGPHRQTGPHPGPEGARCSAATAGTARSWRRSPAARSTAAISPPISRPPTRPRRCRIS